MKAAHWIDRVKTVNKWDSDYRVAHELGLTRSAISKHRTRESTLDEDTSVKVAHALGINPAIVLTDQAMERAKDGEARTAWGTVLDRLGGVAAACLIGVGLTSAPPPANASQAQSALSDAVYYVKSLMGAITAFFRAPSALFPRFA